MTQAEAIAKYKKYKSLDPFPSIKPAFLNSTDVHDYINTVGMVYPYEEKQLNGVTLTLRVGDLAIYWNEKNEKIRKDIKADREFKLMSNSIAYIQILEELRLPAYIIARFNLRVTITYRGLLLGTGPIVDPGFSGKINIPIHNLTNNDYVFGHGDSLIEMEFTKISSNSLWAKHSNESFPEPPRTSGYKNWKPNNDNIDPELRDIDYYLHRANQGRSIQSSLPPIVHQMEKLIEKSDANVKAVDTKVEGVSKQVRRHFIGSIITVSFAFLAFVAIIVAIIDIFKSDVRDIRSQKEIESIIELKQLRSQDSLFYNAQIQTLIQQRNRDRFLLDSVIKKIHK